MSNLMSFGAISSSGISILSTLRLRVDSTSRYLINDFDNPYFVNASTAWSAMGQLTRTEWQFYLDNRTSKGITAVILSLFEWHFSDNAPNTVDGIVPFTTSNDFATLNPLYMERAIEFIDDAADRNIVVFLWPVYLGFNGGQEGMYTTLVSNGTTKATQLGRDIGTYLKSRPNIVYMLGGDFTPNDLSEVAALETGLRETDPNHIISYHGAPEDSARDATPDIGIDFDTVYTRDGVTSNDVLASYQASPTLPTWLIEGIYEEALNPFAPTPLQLRVQAYGTYLSGGFGHGYGHEEIWHFDASNGFVVGDWVTALNSAGSVMLAPITNLFQSRAWQNLVPDSTNALVTAGRGTVGTQGYVPAAKTSDGSLAIIYIPGGGQITIDMSVMSLPIQAYWYDPTNGSSTETSGSPFSVAQSENFTPPGNNNAGDSDWILLLEN